MNVDESDESRGQMITYGERMNEFDRKNCPIGDVTSKEIKRPFTEQSGID